MGRNNSNRGSGNQGNWRRKRQGHEVRNSGRYQSERNRPAKGHHRGHHGPNRGTSWRRTRAEEGSEPLVLGTLTLRWKPRTGRSTGPSSSSSMDNVETAIIASSLETIDRIGPCNAIIKVTQISDIRATKRTAVVDRAKELLLTLVNTGEAASKTVIEEVRSVLTVGTAKSFHGLTCGPNVESSSSLIIVEGRNDVRNLLNCGVRTPSVRTALETSESKNIDLANGKESVVTKLPSMVTEAAKCCSCNFTT